MPSSYTTSLRFELQFTGENLNIWGDKLNAVISRVDDANAGWLTKALSGNYSLTTANGATDEARMAMLRFTGSGAYTVTIPAVSKKYTIWNACSGVLTISNGSASVTVQPAEVVTIVTDGGGNVGRVQPTDMGGKTLTNLGAPVSSNDAATKAYADALAFSASAGNLPGQSGSAGKFLFTNGSTASWASAITTGGGLAVSSGSTLTVTSASASAVRTGNSTAFALTPGDTYSAFAEVALTDAPGSSVAVDMSTLINAVLQFSGGSNTRVLANPTNPKVGQTGWIRLVQSATGSNALTVGTYWKRSGGAPALTQSPNAVDILEYQVITPTYVLYDVVASPS